MRTPRVTEVLARWSDFSMVDPLTFDMATLRGRLVHEACLLDLCHGKTPRYYDAMVESFKSLLEEIEVIASEFEVESELGYIGHPDLLCRYNGKIWLFDLKTATGVSKMWFLQLAAYYYADWELPQPQEAGIIMLDRKGSFPRIVPLEKKYMQHYFAVFLSELTVWRFFNE